MPTLRDWPHSLNDYIASRYTIRCGNCGKRKTITAEELDEATQYLFDVGWRVSTNRHCYCPACAKKRFPNDEANKIN